MSHVIRGTLDTATAPDDAADRIETVKDQFRRILEEIDQEYYTRTDIDDEPLYDRFQLRFDIRDDVAAIVAALADQFDAVDWIEIETREDDREWRDDAFANDPDYYPPDWTDGHRTPPSLDRAGLFEVEAGDVHYLIGGEEYTALSTTLSPEPADGTPRRDLVIVDDSETIERLTGSDRGDLPEGAVAVGLLEVHPGKVVVIDVETIDVETTEWTIAYEHGDVPEDA